MYIAELVTFSEIKNLPSTLRPFAEVKGAMGNGKITDDTKVLIFKIRGTIDSHQTIIVDKDTTVDKIEEELSVNLGCVISKSTKEQLEKIFSNK